MDPANGNAGLEEKSQADHADQGGYAVHADHAGGNENHLYEGTRWLVYVSICVCCKSSTEEGGTKVDCDA